MKNGITLAAAALCGVTVQPVIFLAVTVNLDPQKSNGSLAEQFADLNKSKVNAVKNAYKHNIGWAVWHKSTQYHMYLLYLATSCKVFFILLLLFIKHS